MSGLIFEGNTAKRFGETIPRIFIDRVEVLPQDNIKINIYIQEKIKFNLHYDKNKSLQKKIKLEQLRKETF